MAPGIQVGLKKTDSFTDNILTLDKEEEIMRYEEKLKQYEKELRRYDRETRLINGAYNCCGRRPAWHEGHEAMCEFKSPPVKPEKRSYIKKKISG